MAVKKMVQKLGLRYYKTKFKLLSAVSKRKAAEKAFELFCTPQSRNNNKVPQLYDKAEKLQFIIEGIIVRGWRFNSPGTKKVLILHGFESSVTNFERYVKAFIKKGYEVLAFDAPGHGVSGGKKITAPLYRNMIKEIHKKYGPVESFIAHSFGGLAVCLALEEIKHDEKYRLALIAPAAETNTAVTNFCNFLELDNAVRKEFENVIENAGGKSTDWYSINRALQNIKAKVIWVQDEDDMITPLTDALKANESNYPNVDFVITKGLGHSRIYRDSNIIKTVTDFL